MTDHEISILFLGINLGVMLMVLAKLVFDQTDDRREARADRAVLDKARKDLAAADWRDALTVREPA
jgi:hypothetical protein